MFAGQVMVGGGTTATVTVKEHEAELPRASVAVQVTGVVPGGKGAPLGGVQTTLVIVLQTLWATGAG